MPKRDPAHRLYAVRHAQPLIANGICYGQLDVPADVAATAACAEKLAHELPPRTHVICSPLQRCEQLTPVLIGLRPDLTLETDPRLQEMNFGDWEGRSWNDIGPAAVDAWTADFAHHQPGGGESLTAFLLRVAAAWDDTQRPTEKSRRVTAWITHAGVIRAAGLLHRGIRQIEQASDWPQAAPAFGQWIVLDTVHST